MLWTLFVLDFDRTYDNEEENSDGIQPLVYLVPKDRIKDVRHYAQQSHDDFHSSGIQCIGDYFEEYLAYNNIMFRCVGSIDLSFGERIDDYLENSIPIEYV